MLSMQLGEFESGNLNSICHMIRDRKIHRGYFKNCKATGIGKEEEPNGVTSIGEWKEDFLNGKGIRKTL